MNNAKWKMCVQFILYDLVKGFTALREIQFACRANEWSNFTFAREARKVNFNWKNIKIMISQWICICILQGNYSSRWPESDIDFNCEMAPNMDSNMNFIFVTFANYICTISFESSSGTSMNNDQSNYVARSLPSQNTPSSSHAESGPFYTIIIELSKCSVVQQYWMFYLEKFPGDSHFLPSVSIDIGWRRHTTSSIFELLEDGESEKTHKRSLIPLRLRYKMAISPPPFPSAFEFRAHCVVAISAATPFSFHEIFGQTRGDVAIVKKVK